MAERHIMGQFVADALLAGKSRNDIRDALTEAGWSGREVSDALAEYSEVEFMPSNIVECHLKLTQYCH